MGFIGRAIRKGISEGVGRAVGNAISNAVEPKAAEYANRAANSIDSAARSTGNQISQSTAGLESAFSGLSRSMQNYATEISKHMKICPGCGQPADADKKFCPSCGSPLPEQTLSQDAVCEKCGAQNSIGTKFCAQCGAKLPGAVKEEQLRLSKDASVMDEWDRCLASYPKWNCGGSEYNIEQYDDSYMFSARFPSNMAAQAAVGQYRQLLLQNGFRQAGQHPVMEHLYKMEGGVCYHADTEHCFDGDGDSPCIYFNIGEPYGGFNYVKPEPKKQVSIKDLLGF